jgi:hypothetical protein
MKLQGSVSGIPKKVCRVLLGLETSGMWSFTSQDGGKDVLTNLLKNYDPFLTSRPGKCRVFEYEFRLVDMRPVPFKLRPRVKEQINQLLIGEVLEVCDPHTSVRWQVYHDRATHPRSVLTPATPTASRHRTGTGHNIQKFLQNFYGVNIDLSSEFCFTTGPFQEVNKEMHRVPIPVHGASVFKNSLWV